MKPHTAFFGDGEHSFCLTPAQVAELEIKCGAGIGAICHRVFHRQFQQSDLSETIRLALVGAGTAPKRAAELIAAYVENQPIAEPYRLASKILEKLWFGNPHE